MLIELDKCIAKEQKALRNIDDYLWIYDKFCRHLYSPTILWCAYWKFVQIPRAYILCAVYQPISIAKKKSKYYLIFDYSSENPIKFKDLHKISRRASFICVQSILMPIKPYTLLLIEMWPQSIFVHRHIINHKFVYCSPDKNFQYIDCSEITMKTHTRILCDEMDYKFRW